MRRGRVLKNEDIVEFIIYEIKGWSGGGPILNQEDLQMITIQRDTIMDEDNTKRLFEIAGISLVRRVTTQ